MWSSRLLSAALLLLAATAAPADAKAKAPSPPKLTLVPDGDSVLVQWKYTGKVKRKSSVLELQRSTNGSTYTTIARIARPAKRTRKKAGERDTPADPGTYSYRGRLLTDRTTTAWGPAATVTLAGPPAPDPDPDPDPTPGGEPLLPGQRECPAGTAADVLARVNAERAAAGVGAVAIHPDLAVAARRRAIALAAARVLSHTGWITAIRATGYTGSPLGENLAWGYRDAREVVGAWMTSAGHRANVVNRYFADVGVGCVLDPYGTPWWVQDFGG